MRNTIYHILLAVFLCKAYAVFGNISSIQRDTITETFEGYSTNSSYANAVRNVANTNGLKWTIVNGNINNLKETQTVFQFTKGVILQSNGSAAVSTATALTSGKLCNLTAIHWYAGRSSSSIQMALYYSKDSVHWTKDTTTLSLTTARKEYIVRFATPTTAYIRIIGYCTKNSETGSRYRIYIDNISLCTEQYGEQMDIADWTENDLTLNMNGCAPEAGVSVGIDGGDEQPIEEGNTYSYLGQNDRTYRVETQGLHAGDDVQIVAKYGDKQGNTYVSNRKYRVPYIYVDSVVRKLTYNTDDDIVVRGGKTTLATNAAVRNVYVYPDGELTVADGCTLTCAKLFVRTTATEAGAVSGNIQAHETYYTRIVANKTKYFQFALPVQSTTRDIQTTAGDVCVLDKHWRLNTYDTQLRAEQGNVADNWVRYTGETIEANKGYAMLSASAYYREYLFPAVYSSANSNAEVAVTAPKGEVDAAHDGWNYVCSPYSSKYAGVLADDPTDRVYVSELRKDGAAYWQHVADTIYPAQPFYYQAAEAGSLVFGETLHFEASVSRTVAAYAPATSPIATQWVQLVVSDAIGQTDETNICLHPTKFAEAYEIGRDLIKLRGNGQYVQLYSLMLCGELSFNALPDSVSATGVRLGYYAPQAGTYTLHLDSNHYLERLAHVLLTDKQTNTQADLLLQDYSFTTQAGEQQDRFMVHCVFRTQETPTGMHDGKTAGVAQKILRDGAIYIVRHGEGYDLLGRKR